MPHPDTLDAPAPAAALGLYGGRTRVRVGGLVFDRARSAVLLLEHAGLWADGSGAAPPFWTPPGGGIDFGEPLADALRREVREEAGLDVAVGPLRYVLDFVRPPLHAVSFYFECTTAAPLDPDALTVGHDPELGADAQLIRAARLVPLGELGRLRLYPEGLAAWLQADVPAGFPDGTRYLGTLR